MLDKLPGLALTKELLEDDLELLLLEHTSFKHEQTSFSFTSVQPCGMGLGMAGHEDPQKLLCEEELFCADTTDEELEDCELLALDDDEFFVGHIQAKPPRIRVGRHGAMH